MLDDLVLVNVSVTVAGPVRVTESEPVRPVKVVVLGSLNEVSEYMDEVPLWRLDPAEKKASSDSLADL
jgi:hypothetical protein